jgi:hypothetical protein
MILEMTASALLSFTAVPTRASSETARYLAAEFSEHRRRLRASNSLGLGVAIATEEVARVVQECSTANWDGYGAAAIQEETFDRACAFLEALPLGIPAPSVGAEPDGHLTLEWYRSPRLTLSVSISPEGDLHYAALIGPAKAYGTEPFLGEVPQVILDLIQRVDPDAGQNGLRIAS